MLSAGAVRRQVSHGHPVVLDGQFHCARVLQPAGVAVRGRPSAENHRKHVPVRRETRPTDRVHDTAPLLRDRIHGVHVDAARVREHRRFTQ